MGAVATSHLLLADKQVKGTFSPDCLRLAELHSDAVDFPKTGTPVDIRQLPRADTFKPDSLCAEHRAGRVDEDFYPSPKVLGRLFRDIPLHDLDHFSPSPPTDATHHSLEIKRLLTSHLSQLSIDGLGPSVVLPPPSSKSSKPSSFLSPTSSFESVASMPSPVDATGTFRRRKRSSEPSLRRARTNGVGRT